MIIGIVGDIGCGKTLTMTHLGMLMQKDNVNIYSNYHLGFDHDRIDEIKQIDEIETKTNVLLFDEIWLTADSRQSMRYENMIMTTSVLQSRKRHIDIFYTTQYINQVDVRIRSITSFIFHPTIIVTDSNDIPMYVKVNVLQRNLYGDMIQKKIFNLFIYGTHLLYNTDELIKKTESNKFKPFLEMYKDCKLKKSSLISKLVIDNGLSKTDAELVANYVKTTDEKIKE